MLTRVELENKFNIRIPFLKYYQITSSINSVLKSIKRAVPLSNVDEHRIQKLCLYDLQKVKTQQVYCQLVKDLYQTPKSQDKCIEYYPFLEHIDWRDIYLLPNKIAKATYLTGLQYRILHRIFNCNYKLFLWGIKDSPVCPECNMTENMEHYFYYCETAKIFWGKIETWVNNIFSVNLKLTILDILLGCLNINKNTFYAINSIILYGKYFINRCKQENKSLSWEYFQRMYKNHISANYFAYIQEGNERVFKDKFGLLIDKI